MPTTDFGLLGVHVDTAGGLRVYEESPLFALAREAWPDELLRTLLRTLMAGVILSTAGGKASGFAAAVLKAAAQRLSTPALAAAYGRQLAAEGWDHIMGVRGLLYVAHKSRCHALCCCGKEEELNLPPNWSQTAKQVVVAKIVWHAGMLACGSFMPWPPCCLLPAGMSPSF
jgi:hypothetical protein